VTAFAYYNEIDEFAAVWLQSLMDAGAIMPGYVDTRPIQQVLPDDLDEFTQCHFFAGIGVWSYALRSAGWPDDRPVWTGSCPCQPFSVAGEGKAFEDDRHLWPYWYPLIDLRRPPVIFGEQVASKDGMRWLDLVSTNLEDSDYAFGAADLCAAGVGQPQVRQRLYWVADAYHQGPQGRQPAELPERAGELPTRQSGASRDAADHIGGRDGYYRLVEPGTFPLAARAAGDVEQLRGYGNALCAPVAETFVSAYMDLNRAA